MKSKKILDKMLELYNLMSKEKKEFSFSLYERTYISQNDSLVIQIKSWKSYHLMGIDTNPTLIVEYDCLEFGVLTEEEIINDIDKMISKVKKEMKKRN